MKLDPMKTRYYLLSEGDVPRKGDEYRPPGSHSKTWNCVGPAAWGKKITTEIIRRPMKRGWAIECDPAGKPYLLRARGLKSAQPDIFLTRNEAAAAADGRLSNLIMGYHVVRVHYIEPIII